MPPSPKLSNLAQRLLKTRNWIGFAKLKQHDLHNDELLELPIVKITFRFIKPKPPRHCNAQRHTKIPEVNGLRVAGA